MSQKDDYFRVYFPPFFRQGWRMAIDIDRDWPNRLVAFVVCFFLPSIPSASCAARHDSAILLPVLHIIRRHNGPIWRNLTPIAVAPSCPRGPRAIWGSRSDRRSFHVSVIRLSLFRSLFPQPMCVPVACSVVVAMIVKLQALIGCHFANRRSAVFDSRGARTDRERKQA